MIQFYGFVRTDHLIIIMKWRGIGPHKDELKKYVLDTMRQQEGPLKGFQKVTDILIESRIDAQMAGFTEANEVTLSTLLRCTVMCYTGPASEIYN